MRRYATQVRGDGKEHATRAPAHKKTPGEPEVWTREHLESHWSDLNRRPLDYESSALPLSYSGNVHDHALARIRTATPFGTTPSRWRVYQFHHQGAELL